MFRFREPIKNLYYIDKNQESTDPICEIDIYCPYENTVKSIGEFGVQSKHDIVSG